MSDADQWECIICPVFACWRGVDTRTVVEGRFRRLDKMIPIVESLSKNCRRCLARLCYDSAPGESPCSVIIGSGQNCLKTPRILYYQGKMSY